MRCREHEGRLNRQARVKVSAVEFAWLSGLRVVGVALLPEVAFCWRV